MRGAALLLALWAGVLASAAADDPIRRALLSSAATIYSNGERAEGERACSASEQANRGAAGRAHRPPLAQPPGNRSSAPPGTLPPARIAGQLEWRSWSWGLSYLNLRDASAPMQGSREAMCLGVMPFGALSLRSAMPFALEGALGLYMRAASNTTAAAALGGLELQVGGAHGSRVPAARV